MGCALRLSTHADAVSTHPFRGQMDIQNYEIGGLEETIEPASNMESSIFGVLYQGIYSIYSPY